MLKIEEIIFSRQYECPRLLRLSHPWVSLLDAFFFSQRFLLKQKLQGGKQANAPRPIVKFHGRGEVGRTFSASPPWQQQQQQNNISYSDLSGLEWGKQECHKWWQFGYWWAMFQKVWINMVKKEICQGMNDCGTIEVLFKILIVPSLCTFFLLHTFFPPMLLLSPPPHHHRHLCHLPCHHHSIVITAPHPHHLPHGISFQS